MDIQSASSVAMAQDALAQSQLKNKQANESGESFEQVLARASNETGKVADAAKQFEALIAGQVLKAAREASDGGWLGTSDDQTGELALEMAEQGFAQALAARGGLGVSKAVVASLHRSAAKDASSGPPAAR
ncbi:MAG: hypothetical protein LAP38_17545 [Acidobacteriia bacterium]|nr:hypothetical protein [Terriglobia bacterium]